MRNSLNTDFICRKFLFVNKLRNNNKRWKSEREWDELSWGEWKQCSWKCVSEEKDSVISFIASNRFPLLDKNFIFSSFHFKHDWYVKEEFCKAKWYISVRNFDWRRINKCLNFFLGSRLAHVVLHSSILDSRPVWW